MQQQRRCCAGSSGGCLRVDGLDHVDVIRIGTRVPVVLPMRITQELTDMLRKYHPIWINTHFNHPNELTPEAARACAAIVDAGIPLGNQTVLLRGVNDPQRRETILDVEFALEGAKHLRVAQRVVRQV